MIRKGQKVHIRPEWQDPGDDEFIRIALENEDGGRVLIRTLIPEFTIMPTEVIKTQMLIEGDATQS